MLERRPLFGALIGAMVVWTLWHMSFQQATSVANSGSIINTGSGGGGSNSLSFSGVSYPDSPAIMPPFVQTPVSPITSTPLHFQPPAPPPSSITIDDDGGGLTAAGTVGSGLPNHTSILVNPVETLPKDDYTSLIDLKDFKFTINFINRSESRRKRSKRENIRSYSLKCDERRSPLVLVLVHSAPTNWYKRNTIRDTWGQNDPRARLVFLLGAVNSTILQRRIEKETRLYNDIVQGNFVDAYRNMTYKHVMALKWFTYHCPDAKYILKTDDDVFVNTPTLYDTLESTSQRRRLLFCQEISQAPVKRTHRSKWYVSVPEYRSKYYPSHCPGYSIMYTPDVAFLLYREAQKQPYFWIDDVHLTGTIAQRVNVTITPLGSMLLSKKQKNAIIERRLNATEQPFFFTTPDLHDGDIRKLWEAVVQSRLPATR